MKQRQTKHNLSRPEFGQIIQFPQLQSAPINKKTTKQPLALAVWASLCICGVAFGIGCVGVDLLSDKQEPLAIKDSKSRTRISSFLERVAVASSKESNDLNTVSEDDFSKLSAAEKPEQKPLTRPPSKVGRAYKDGLQKQVTVPSASFQLPTLPERTKVPHELIPKISIPTPKLPATPPAPKITIPNLSNA
ncbi:hypothetical protein H6S82_21160 [Planktothrix sp. FACHB-1355]|uniref:Uncharacterized protein n=1 Tax=Aerosakkonema funiforme FACHB-1375 TaxID=2949571 RepID=A0A926VC44_9CYAN|nr:MULTISPECIES: hypothetical protein [Oscillatoriales]MBD2180633.1 hypothetical protein [Aerosakkonema funiforme FACHB-1375]MBD3561330.1 hypothetical protein [Planktothrix sp. FACHB-1355]